VTGVQTCALPIYIFSIIYDRITFKAIDKRYNHCI